MSGGQGTDLTDAALNALQWSYAGRAVQIGAQLAIGVVLARMLGPEPFGLVAMAWLLVGLANQVADLGLSSALVQRPSVSREEIRYVFTMQLMTGVGLAVAVAATAGPAAHAFQTPLLVPVARWLSLIFVLQSFGQTPTSLLKRNLDFKSIQFGQVASYALSYLILGIPLAALGCGVWSLVAAQLTQSALYAFVVCVRRPYPCKPLLRLHSAGLLSFGSQVTGVNLLNFGIVSLDTAVLGRCFGATALGLYNRTFNLLSGPTNGLLSTLQAVLFPAYSQRQENEEALRRVYFSSVAALGLVLIPAFAAAAAAPATIVLGVYGAAWAPAEGLLVPLSMAMMAHSLMGLAGPLLWARARVDLELRVSALIAALFIPVLYVFSRYSFEAVAWGVLLVYALRFLMMTGSVLRQIGGSWKELLVAIRGACLLGVAIAIVVFGTDGVLASLGIGAAWRVGLLAVLSTSVAAIATLAFPDLIFGPALSWILSRVADRLPPAVAPFLRKVVKYDAAEVPVP